MTQSDLDGGITRDDLLQRVALMEAMVGEGRRATTRSGWVFLMWGLIYFAAMGWMLFLPAAAFAWPVCIVVGVAIVIAVKTRQKRAGAVENTRSRSVEAVWIAMGTAVSLFVVMAIVTNRAGDATYVAAILFMVGMAHAASALMLRWVAQGLAAAVWWGCGIATFFLTTEVETISLFLAAAFFGMVLFGLYAMMLERRSGAAPVQRHA
jgi:hypothetical protein